MTQHIVATKTELPLGSRKIVRIGQTEIGLFNVGGEYRAVRNVCPHHGAPLCQGKVGGTNLPSLPGQFVWGQDGEILRCPWHAWEFDLQDGRALAAPEVRCRMYEVTVQGENVVLTM